MSDGGREASRDDQKNSKKSSGLSGGDEFGRAIAKIAVAQILETTGFHSSQHSALDALADVLIRYIRDLGKTANFYANLSGRTACSVFDIIQGLEDLGAAHGFAGGSDVQRCLVSSGVVQEITDFVNTEDEVPFARPVTTFPIFRPSKLIPSFAQIGEAPSGKHIPDWLPAFPDPHTYIRTPVWNERASDLRADKIEQAKQRRKAERSLLSLQQRLLCNGAAGPFTSDGGDVGKGKQVASSNPFLAPPLPFGEKEVSDVAVMDGTVDKREFSVLETFKPAIEAAKDGSFDYEVSEKKVLPTKRPTVHFKFGIDKKSIAAPLSSGVLGVRNDSWHLKEDERDDKKRRAEMILREAMENPQELTQL